MPDSTSWYNLVKDILSPTTIAVIGIVLTDWFARRHSREQERIDRQRTQASLVDTLIIGLETTIATLETLKTDAETRSYFAFTQLNVAKSLLSRLEKVVDNVVVITNERLRREIIEKIDSLASLIQDMESIENYKDLRDKEFNTATANLSQQRKSLQLELLKLEIVIEDGVPISTTGSVLNGQTSKILAVLDQEITDGFTAEQAKLDNATAFCKDRRVFLTVRLVDLEAKLRELKTSLEQIRKGE